MNRTTVSIDTATNDQLTAASELLNISKNELLSELAEAIASRKLTLTTIKTYSNKVSLREVIDTGIDKLHKDAERYANAYATLSANTRTIANEIAAPYAVKRIVADFEGRSWSELVSAVYEAHPRLLTLKALNNVAPLHSQPMLTPFYYESAYLQRATEGAFTVNNAGIIVGE